MRTDDGRASPTGTPRRDVPGYRFGPFLVDPNRRLLWRDAKVVPLTGKTFDLLLVLLDSRGQVIDKDSLLARVWPGSVVQENNLVRHISTLRRALSQRLDQHEPIVTVSGRGYRFVAEVAELDHLPPGLPSSANGSESYETSVAIDPIHPFPAPVSAPASRRWTWRSVASLSVALVAVVALAVISWNWRSSSAGSDLPRALRQFTYEAGLQQGPAWAPDGTKIAYASDGAGNSDIWLQTLADPTPVRITTSPEADWQPDWSPDGQWIAFRSERNGGGIFVVPAAGGEARRVTQAGFSPRWSPDGRRLLFVNQGLRGPKMTASVVDVSGGEPRPVRPDLTDPLFVVNVGWSPDGRVSILSRERNAPPGFVTAALDGGAAVRSTLSAQALNQLKNVSIDRFVWSPQGTSLFLEGESQRVRNILRVQLQSRTLEWEAVEAVTTGAGQDSDLAISADGHRLAFTVRSERTRLWSFPFDTGSAALTGPGQPLTPGGAGEYDAAATPDGTKLAYRTNRADRQELWEHSVDSGQDRLLLASADSSMTSPRWSRDGTKLAYSRTPRGASFNSRRTVAILAVNGGREQVMPVADTMNFVPDDWSLDGSTILGACSTGTGRRAICVMSSSSVTPPAQVRVIASDPARALICERFSPDQKWISFMAADRSRGVSTLYVMPADGGSWIQMTDGVWYDDKPRWSSDGRTLLFISNRGGLLNLWARRFSPETGQPVGAAFRVSGFNDLQQTIAPNQGQTEIAVSTDRVFLPIRESSGKIWILDQIDR